MADRLGRIENILNGLGTPEDFAAGFGQAFNLDSEDRRDVLYAHREAEGKAAIPPRHVQILSQHPLVDTIRQHASTTENQIVRNALTRIGLGPFSDGMYSFRTNTGMNVGGPVDEEGRISAWDLSEPTPDKARKQIEKDKARIRGLPTATKAGYALGGMANDFTNNATRNIYWLINAPQAIVDVASEGSTAAANPDLYAEETISLDEAIDKKLVRYAPDYDEKRLAKEVSRLRNQSAQFDYEDILSGLSGADTYGEKGEKLIEQVIRNKAQENLYSPQDARNYKRAAPGIRIRSVTDEQGQRHYDVRRRRFSPTLVNAASMLPAAIAINAGIGLMGTEDNGAIGGRQAGYTAALPDELDPRTSSNAIGEVAWRYMLGREGRLMEQDDFILERPDVSPGQYQGYKGYLRDRDFDLNPLDGKINIGGILKTNPDGIRGAEVSFLGKSMGVNDTLIPTASAIGGSVLGALAGRHPSIRKNKAAVIGALAGGGAAGLVGCSAVGTVLEEDRRRSNFEARHPNLDYDAYKANARQLLDRKYELIKANPSAKDEKAKSNAGLSKRAQQAALQEIALEQQTMIDQLVNSEAKRRALEADAKRKQALEESNQIESSIR